MEARELRHSTAAAPPVSPVTRSFRWCVRLPAATIWRCSQSRAGRTHCRWLPWRQSVRQAPPFRTSTCSGGPTAEWCWWRPRCRTRPPWKLAHLSARGKPGPEMHMPHTAFTVYSRRAQATKRRILACNCRVQHREVKIWSVKNKISNMRQPSAFNFLRVSVLCRQLVVVIKISNCDNRHMHKVPTLFIFVLQLCSLRLHCH